MCGICGFISPKDISLEQLQAMNDAMAHRGPDDAGAEIFRYDRVHWLGMAHRRLSILDLSEKGRQPLHSPSGDVVVVFNGEIYNYQALKDELRDYPFISTCDTEVIVAAYEKWGRDFVSHLDGMFAIALYDRNRRTLYLTRDRIGKKPLYYYVNQDDFVFASSPTPLMLFPGIKKEINKESIPRFLYNRYIAGDMCIFRHVHKVLPGEIIEYTDGTYSRRRYWDLIAQYEEQSRHPIRSYAQAKEMLRERIFASVERRMVADVSVGAFLSGGFDSTLVTAVAQQLSAKPLKTFSIGFENPDFNEAPYAMAVARHLGTQHVNHDVTEADMLQMVERIPACYDEPFADSSQIPSMLVASIAKQDVTVVLTGDGGDEFFCGYSLYDKIKTAQQIEPFAALLRRLPMGSAAMNRLPFAVRAILLNDNERHKTQFGRRGYEACIQRMLPDVDVELPYNESDIPVKSWQIRRMLLDSITYLPDNNLCKVDRATMMHSLEARNPLLDVSLIETAFRIPHEYKYHQGDKKHILKDLTYDYVPRELMDREKKGFAAPVDQWLRGALKEDVLALTDREYLKAQGIFDPDYTSAYVRQYIQHGDQGLFSGSNPSNIVWPLYMFQKWYQHHMR